MAASSMRMVMSDIAQLEKNILAKQFINSPFYKQQQSRAPVTLDIFDFDSTLFLSPLLSSNLWHSSFINAITTENLIGPGWWRDIRSLQFEGTYQTLQSSSWKGYWNEDVVEQVKLSSQDPLHMTVLLTGRRYHPFHTLIEAMLKSKGLIFDIIGLRPDPDTPEPSNMYNIEPNVFDTTMDFKTAFIVHLLSTVPTLKEIVMWDDRTSHITAFQTYLREMVSENIISAGKLICVKAARPKYDPKWELETIQDMISTHNETLKGFEEIGAITVAIENYGQQLIDSTKTMQLQQVPYISVLKLDKQLVLHLKSVFEPLFFEEITTTDTEPAAEWETYAERPLFFGDQVFLGMNEQQQEEQDFKIVARSKATREEGMMLQVQIGEKLHILPLWYKPSDFTRLLKREYQWIPVQQQDDLDYKGTFGYHHLYILNSLE